MKKRLGTDDAKEFQKGYAVRGSMLHTGHVPKELVNLMPKFDELVSNLIIKEIEAGQLSKGGGCEDG